MTAGLPPAAAPPGCWSPPLWMLARQVLVDHRPALDRHCVLCRPLQVAPCRVRQIAVLVLNATLFPGGREIICPARPDTVGPGFAGHDQEGG